MDLTTYRLDQFERRADAADARMARVEEELTEIHAVLTGVATKDSVAGLASKDAIRSWGLAVMAIVAATGVGMTAILLQSAANQFSSFQAGLSAIQAIVAAPELPALPAQPSAPAARDARPAPAAPVHPAKP